jgi:rubrerythrin
MTIFRSGDELASMLRKALQIEEGFESVAQWEAYVSTQDDKFRTMLFQLLSDSERHKGLVEQMLSKVKVSNPKQAAPLSPKVFDFSGQEDQEVMDQLFKTENLMLNTYILIKEGLTSGELEKLIDPADKDFFLTTLSDLIREEGIHASLVSSKRGKMIRIR